jgi:coenzyme F420-reducing hydrogenase delta subunit
MPTRITGNDKERLNLPTFTEEDVHVTPSGAHEVYMQDGAGHGSSSSPAAGNRSPGETRSRSEQQRRVCDGLKCDVTTDLKRCACLIVLYCSRRCQEEAWRAHRATCKAARDAKNQQVTPKSISEVNHFVTTIEMMREMVCDAEVQYRALRSMFEHLSCKTRVKNLTRAANVCAIIAVVGAIHEHPDNQIVHGSACHVLLYLFQGDAENKNRARDAGAVEAMVAAMRGHTEWTAVQSHMQVMVRLLMDNTENILRAEKAGAVEASLMVMQGQTGTECVQVSGCLVMHLILSSGSGDADSKVQAVNAGAVEVIMMAMRKHPHNETIQMNGCCTFGDLVTATNISKAQLLSIMKAADAAIEAHSGSTMVITNARWLLDQVKPIKAALYG